MSVIMFIMRNYWSKQKQRDRYVVQEKELESNESK